VLIAVAELTLLVVLAGLLVYAFAVWSSARPAARPGPVPGGLPPRERAALAAEVAGARWLPAHDEVEGTTRVLLRRSYTGLDGLPAVLEERVFAVFPADDPAWEARFSEAMAGARFRCDWLNTEEGRG
jgi:hypothetical protein